MNLRNKLSEANEAVIAIRKYKKEMAQGIRLVDTEAGYNTGVASPRARECYLTRLRGIDRHAHRASAQALGHPYLAELHDAESEPSHTEPFRALVTRVGPSETPECGLPPAPPVSPKSLLGRRGDARARKRAACDTSQI